MTTALDITQLLQELNENPDTNARKNVWDKLTPMVYEQMRKIANYERGKLIRLETLSATALVNEAFLKLSNHKNLSAESRAHFFAISAKAMRQILINYLEHKNAQKRGGDWKQVTMEELSSGDGSTIDGLIARNCNGPKLYRANRKAQLG